MNIEPNIHTNPIVKYTLKARVETHVQIDNNALRRRVELYSSEGQELLGEAHTHDVIPHQFRVVARYTCDDGAGLVIHYRPRKELQELHLPLRELSIFSKALRILGDAGVEFIDTAENRTFLLYYLSSPGELPSVHRLMQSGWHLGEDPIFIAGKTLHRSYVIGGGDTTEDIKEWDLGPTDAALSPIHIDEGEKGKRAWLSFMEALKRLPIAQFSVMYSLASALARPLRINGVHGMVVLHGDSSTGKTTSIKAARSVWGFPHAQTQDCAIESFHSTPKYLVKKTECYRDQCMAIEETQLADPFQFANFVMCASGISRGTLTQETAAREGYGIPALVIGCGEVAPSTMLKRAKASAGHFNRCCGIDVTDDRIFNTLSQPEIRNIESGMRAQTGYAGATFVRRIIDRLSEVFIEKQQARFGEIMTSLLGSQAVTQVERATKKFALAQLAGELAQDWGLLDHGWDPAEIVRNVHSVWMQQDGQENLDPAMLAAQNLLEFIDEETGNGIVVDYTIPQRGKKLGYIDDGILFITRQALQKGIGKYGIKPFCHRLHAQKLINEQGGRFAVYTGKLGRHYCEGRARFITVENGTELIEKREVPHNHFPESAQRSRTYQIQLHNFRKWASGESIDDKDVLERWEKYRDA